jgi:Zn-dependent protease
MSKVNVFSFAPFIFKCFGVFLKFAKSLKLIFALGTFATYSFLLSWKFALLFMFGVGIHEMGHVWAMKRCGLTTKGFYFIPFVGGAAIADEAFRSGKEEIYIALWGPAFGIVTVSIPLILFVATGSNMWSAAASWLATVNIFNLFPINPLDGGRVTKALAFSFEKRIGFILMGLGFILAMFIANKYHLSLLVFIACIGLMEIDVLRSIILSIAFAPFALVFAIAVLIYGLIRNRKLDFAGFVGVFTHTIFNKDNYKSRSDSTKNWHLSKSDKLMFMAAFCGMVVLFLSVILMLHGPGSDLSKQLLQS